SGTGAGIRVQSASTAWLPWVAARACAIAEVAIAGPLSVRASGAIGVPIVAPSFAITGAGSLRPSAPFTLEGALALVVELT
ncbi:MAG: hypothetical protein M3Y87_29750, partial [Myxococcota bacterium]|nr:hypothetical protein [Myxococcota bacterium]